MTLPVIIIAYRFKFKFIEPLARQKLTIDNGQLTIVVFADANILK